jgi:UDP-2,3-diacylglucosamine pyrophosphatase LpxH
MIKHSVWTDEELKRLEELRNEGNSYQKIADILTSEFNQEFTFDGVRNRLRRTSVEEAEALPNYREEYRIDPDGTHKSDKLLRMSVEQLKDVNYLLEAHGFNKDSWELVTAKNNIWNTNDKINGVQTLYASKITVKPKEQGVNWDDLIEKLSNVPSVIVKKKEITHEEIYLNLPLFDMHFGPSTYDYYKETQAEILALLESNYKEVLLIIGQDLLHTDDFRGRTSSGREIGKIDFPKAWYDAARFYEPIIRTALERSKVKIMYSKGNHDESMSWAFVQYLKGKYPQAKYDDSFRERKVHMLGTNFVGVNHGDKKKDQNLTENFSTEYPIEWSRATTREIFTGHLHHERVLDKGGAVIRRMPTGNEIDEYHEDMGYTTAHKRFQVFEYNHHKVKKIYYI